MVSSVLGVDPALIDYQGYRFGRSKQRFRGPRPNLKSPYVAFIGGSETYGKFVERPFPTTLQAPLGRTCANWGSPEAGPGFFLKDPVLLEACSNAKICVVTVMGAVNLSNRLYSVFKRRNARVRETSKTLKALYPNTDFGGYRFAHNMLYKLQQANPANFAVVELELREAWVARMRELLEDIETTRVVLWMSTRTPDEEASADSRDAFVTSPAFVNREMIEEIAPMADLVVEYVPDPNLAGRPVKTLYTSADDDTARWRYPSQAMHDQLADILSEPLQSILGTSIEI